MYEIQYLYRLKDERNYKVVLKHALFHQSRANQNLTWEISAQGHKYLEY
jgi:hypothetical protein